MTNQNSMLQFFRVADSREKIKLVSYLLLSIAAISLSALSVRFVLTAKRRLEKPVTVAHNEETDYSVIRAEQEFSLTYEIKDMAIGFINRTGNRTAYAQITILFDCETDACVKNLTLNRAKLLDTIFLVAGNYYIEDFTAPLVEEGMKRFKLALLLEIKKNFPGETPRKVVFRDWFMN